MVEFTDDAREYLEGYLRQVSALARRNGDDVDEIVGGLRGHVEELASSGGVESVDLDLLLEVLHEVGSPSEVMGGDGGSERKTRVVPEMVSGGSKEEVSPPQVIVQQQKSGW